MNLTYEKGAADMAAGPVTILPSIFSTVCTPFRGAVPATHTYTHTPPPPLYSPDQLLPLQQTLAAPCAHSAPTQAPVPMTPWHSSTQAPGAKPNTHTALTSIQHSCSSRDTTSWIPGLLPHFSRCVLLSPLLALLPRLLNAVMIRTEPDLLHQHHTLLLSELTQLHVSGSPL